ncbi:MAG TPA: hypothetical protein VGQ71_11860 [Terriglobales bacterium]|jgi:hypothetical protein|nr:hypothetical protein [Terriglobales bacterium]
MRGRFQPALLCSSRWLCALLLLLGPVGARAGEVIDRIVATVDHRIILESEWDEAVRFECFMDSRPVLLTAEERRKSLDRLIDRALILGQMESVAFPRSGAEEIAKRVADVRRQNPAWRTDEGWRAARENYGLSEQDIAEHIATQLDVLRYIDQRFRPGVYIDKRSIESYYLDRFLPELKGEGAHKVPLREVSAKIQEILLQQRIEELFTSWLRNLRDQIGVQLR